jgi:hypothetical protein
VARDAMVWENVIEKQINFFVYKYVDSSQKVVAYTREAKCLVLVNYLQKNSFIMKKRRFVIGLAIGFLSYNNHLQLYYNSMDFYNIRAIK